ncbi:MAG: hypothetical protein QOH84_5241 [Kribbellaceae bacterium]|jgi:hypothetical protein|nr:hypothetical protein [Kribbellaceae bacterium]
MRQLRGASGVEPDKTTEILNETIKELYPDAREGAGEGGERWHSIPRLVSPRYLLLLERGDHSKRDPSTIPRWLKLADVTQIRANASRVRPWLVRAYDVAFGGDGFLADVYAWSVALQEDQWRDLPRRVRDLPGTVAAGDEYAYLTRDLGEVDGQLRAVLEQQAAELAGLRDRFTAAPRDFGPLTDDKTGFLGEAEEEAPEGMLTAPGSLFVARFVMHNVGRVPWRDRLIYRVGDSSIGLASSPCVPMPDTDPGSANDVRCVVRAPSEPGTYRACFKLGWPDGTYCFPTTLLGVIITVVVPPADLADPYPEWPDHG